ncbi:hypothetical protein M758_10G085100 [Ceratodon purpureus]|uniref:Uncharacterized protein n=1 Tax=Ceratodon purpureus TaxID=3225 RepID=A0A8T0GQC1_CERPU|nr:hypothetical protein KC19_10G086600 [Ceratodon purpureus]KAG0603327.1 hypothetical protein M758_10G085100 [Ceratodon purpureus]
MMLHGVSSAVVHGLSGGGFARRGVCGEVGVLGRRCVLRRGDGGVLCDGIGSVSHFGGFRERSNLVNVRVDSSGSFGGGGNAITVAGFGGRRHNRRREAPGGSVSARKQRGDDKVEITLDFEELKQRAGEAAVASKRALVSSVGKARQAGANFVQDGKQAWKELRSSVAVQNDKRVVIAVRRSTIEFAGRTLIWTVLTIVFARILLAWARRFRWGWEEGFNWPRTVRDRSLGGKEVVVKSGIKLWEGGPAKKAFRKTALGLSPLDSVMTDTRSEKEIHRLKASGEPLTSKKIQKESRLPPWWPAPEQAPTLPLETTAEAQREANTLLNDMLERRMNGIDFERHNIIKLRELCRNYGARVSFETANTRDTFYRTAVQLVHNVCVRGGEFPDEGVGKFIAGLAGNIGLDAEKAAIMVIASVAARTRAAFLQTWALHERGEIQAAHKELEGLVRIHENFSPVRNSPEMEMAARGLTYLPVEDRRVLLEMYIFAGGSNTQWLAKEALSLL